MTAASTLPRRLPSDRREEGLALERSSRRCPELAEASAVERTAWRRTTLPWIDCDARRPAPAVRRRQARRRRAAASAPIEIGRVEVETTTIRSAASPATTAGRCASAATMRRAGLVQIVHVSTGAADHLAAEIVLDVDAQASIVETFIGDGWTNRLTGIALGKGARLMLNRRLLGDERLRQPHRPGRARRRRQPRRRHPRRGRRATPGSTARSTSIGEGAYAEAAGALLARGRQRHDANLVIRHAVPNGTSRQVWRSVADDKAACSVAARVEVARDAQKTDGEQSLKGLLLARSATINAKPELEIFADDVKCAHGATVGELDRNALFYLESRGVTPDEARALLTRAFVADALDRIGEEEVREAFYADAEGWFALMDMAAVSTRPLDWLADFPAIPEGWAYLDSAATAQKPQAGDRRDRPRLWRDLCDRPSRRLPALGRDDPGLRGAARARRRASSAPPRRRRSSSSAARPKGSTSSRRAGAAPT